MTALMADGVSVSTFIFSSVTSVINLVTSNPVLTLFVCIGLAGIAIKIGYRVLRKTKKMAN